MYTIDRIIGIGVAAVFAGATAAATKYLIDTAGTTLKIYAASKAATAGSGEEMEAKLDDETGQIQVFPAGENPDELNRLTDIPHVAVPSHIDSTSFSHATLDSAVPNLGTKVSMPVTTHRKSMMSLAQI
jgi:hypothetical protein